MKAICIDNSMTRLKLYKWYNIEHLYYIDKVTVAVYHYNSFDFIDISSSSNFKSINELREERVDEII